MTTYGANVNVASFSAKVSFSSNSPTEAEILAYGSVVGDNNSYYGFYGLSPSHFAGAIQKSGSVLVYRYQATNSLTRI
jgi:hypothetical protein